MITEERHWLGAPVLLHPPSPRLTQTHTKGAEVRAVGYNLWGAASPNPQEPVNLTYQPWLRVSADNYSFALSDVIGAFVV